MKKYFLSLVILLATTGCASLKTGDVGNKEIGDDIDRFVYAPDDLVEGKTLPDWSVYWWDWANSTDAPADRDGRQCGEKQNFGVWFLAGSYSKEAINRRCVIPQGKALIFPIINVISKGPVRGNLIGICLCNEYEKIGIDSDTKYQDLYLKINGVSYSNNLSEHYIEKKACVNRLLCEDTITSSGVYAALRPLPPGEYKIEFGGSGHGFSQNITYTVQIE